MQRNTRPAAQTSNDAFFSPHTPLGIGSLPRVRRVRDARQYNDILFDNNNTLSSQLSTVYPSILLGRRGSGKTAFLYRLCFANRYQYQIIVDSPRVLAEIVKRVEELYAENRPEESFLVENIARIWEATFLTAAISEVYQNSKNDSLHKDDISIDVMGRFLEVTGIHKAVSPRTILKRLSDLAQKALDGKYDFVSDFIEEVYLDQFEFNEALEAFQDFCERNHAQVIILMDSVEQLPTKTRSFSISLSGLLHFLGQTRLRNNHVEMCLCIPSELYYHFRGLSYNPDKDFPSLLTLQWTAADLIKLTASRFRTALKSNPELRRLANVQELDLSNTTPPYVFWKQFFPERITNRKGTKEDTIPYIIRHTQLLPRHVINVFNKIIGSALSRGVDGFLITEEDVIDGVRETEARICEGVINSFKPVHGKTAEAMCEAVLPHLPNPFQISDFQKANRHHGRGLIKDYHEAFRMFTEMGIFGKLRRKTKLFFGAEFEYTVPAKLICNENDIFCVHPAFSGTYGAGKVNGSWITKQVVYPRGTQLTRELQEPH